MSKETARQELNTLLERLRLEQTIEDMQAEVEGRTQTTSQATVDKAMARIKVSIERFARGENVGLENDETPATSAVRAPWDGLRNGLAWLSMSLDSLARPAAAAPAGYRRSPGSRSTGMADVPAALQWRPTGASLLSTGQMSLTLAFTNSGIPTVPAIDLRYEGNPIEAAKTTFNADTRTLTIRLPKLDNEAKLIEVAQIESGGVLVINVVALEEPER